MSNLSIIIFTDGVPGLQSLGSTRTLQNLFGSTPDVYFVCTPVETGVTSSYDTTYFVTPSWLSRVFRGISPLHLSTVRSWRSSPPLPTLASPKIAVVSASRIETFIYAHHVTRAHSLPLVPFFMDDLSANDSKWWIPFSGRSFFRKMLDESPGILCNSERLFTQISAHYNVSPSSPHFVHNPVDLSLFHSTPSPPDGLPSPEDFLILYTGSVWEMHRDALILLGRAVQRICDTGVKIRLEVLCPREHYPAELALLHAVHWQDLVPYAELPTRLSSASLLAVCASFSISMQHLSSGSIQTKITDYMAAQRPLLGIGPCNGASMEFIARNKAGFIIDDYSLDGATAKLQEVLSAQTSFTSIGLQNRILIEKQHEQSIVSNATIEYLRNLAV